MSLVSNKYNLNDIVILKGMRFREEYKIVGINLDTYNGKKQSIWYRLYRLSDGYVCVVKEVGLESVEDKK